MFFILTQSLNVVFRPRKKINHTFQKNKKNSYIFLDRRNDKVIINSLTQMKDSGFVLQSQRLIYQF